MNCLHMWDTVLYWFDKESGQVHITKSCLRCYKLKRVVRENRRLVREALMGVA